MRKILCAVLMIAALSMASIKLCAQNTPASGKAKTATLYDEQINPMEQIDAALKTAGKEGKYLVCQVGGNWCKWCIRFAGFITKDPDISKVVNDNFVYIHVNHDPKKPHHMETMKRLENPGRFGFPCLVIMDAKGKVIHIQDSSYLESGEGYDKDVVLKFFQKWTPASVNTIR